ncbi:DNA polymerase III subunit delta' [Corynebacterium sp. 335C]
MNQWSVLDRVPEAGGVRDLLARAAEASRAPDPASAGMTHSWLFTGAPGSGRSEAAFAFAAALAGLDRGEVEGEQPARWKEHVAAHPDILRVRAEGREILVGAARDVVMPFAYRRPTGSPWRVVIVEEADRLRDETANALLKVVEEPPARTVFLMCAPSTNPRDFSVTLRSRCRHVHVPVPSVDHVAATLRADDPSLTEEQARWSAAVANCHIGRARKLAHDASVRDWREKALRFAEGVFDPAVSYQRGADIVSSATGQAAHELEAREAEELEKLEASLGVGAKGRGAASATRGAKGQVTSLEKDQNRRRKRHERNLVDLALMDVQGLYRDAIRESLGAGGEPITVDRGRTITELVRRVPPERLVECFDAVGETRGRLDTELALGPLIDGLVGRLQIACGVGRR